MFRRNCNVVSPRGKIELLIIIIGVLPFGKKKEYKARQIIIQALLVFVHKFSFHSYAFEFKRVQHQAFSFEFSLVRFISFVYIVYSFVTCLSRPVGLETQSNKLVNRQNRVFCSSCARDIRTCLGMLLPVLLFCINSPHRHVRSPFNSFGISLFTQFKQRHVGLQNLLLATQGNMICFFIRCTKMNKSGFCFAPTVPHIVPLF